MTRKTDTSPPVPIIYEDKHILLVDKPHGLLSQSDQTGDPDVHTLCKQYLREKEQSGSQYLGLVHRLDRPVGGLMLLAKTPDAARQLGEQLQDRIMQKTYKAVVQGSPPPNGVLTHHLVKNRDNNMVTVSSGDDPNAKEAILSFQRVQQHKILALLAIHLQTGRPHQIRVQLAEQGYPVWGDYRYGHQQPDGRTIALRATQLAFKSPDNNQLMEFELELPDRAPWHHFFK